MQLLGTSLWALAAFSEPTVGPSASIQDFATNILGANNSDNAFDSSDVEENMDGSVLERLEALDGVGPIMASPTTFGSHSAIVSYCENLSAKPIAIRKGVSVDVIETYSDWRVPTLEEAMQLGFYSGMNASFATTTPCETAGQYAWVNSSSGSISCYGTATSAGGLCVR